MPKRRGKSSNPWISGEDILPPSSDIVFINMLPNELLILIFQRAVRDHVPPPNSFPGFSQTCRRWRCLAVGTGNIWSRILITDRRSLALARTSLERSRGSLLDVTIRPRCRSSVSTSLERWRQFNAVDELLLPIGAKRLGFLQLDWRSYKDMERMATVLTQLATSPASSTLRGVRIVGPISWVEMGAERGMGHTGTAGLDLARSIPIVMSMMERPRVDFPPNRVSNLRKLVLSLSLDRHIPMIVASLLDGMLRASPGLEELMVGRLGIAHSLAPTNERGGSSDLLMPCLQSISIVNVRCEVEGWLLGALRTPLLQFLHLDIADSKHQNCSARESLSKILGSIHPKSQPTLQLSLHPSSSLMATPNSGDFLSSLSVLGCLQLTSIEWDPGYEHTLLQELPCQIRSLHISDSSGSLKWLQKFGGTQRARGSAVKLLVLDDCGIRLDPKLKSVAEVEGAFYQGSFEKAVVAGLKKSIERTKLIRCSAFYGQPNHYLYDFRM